MHGCVWYRPKSRISQFRRDLRYQQCRVFVHTSGFQQWVVQWLMAQITSYIYNYVLFHEFSVTEISLPIAGVP